MVRHRDDAAGVAAELAEVGAGPGVPDPDEVALGVARGGDGLAVDIVEPSAEQRKASKDQIGDQ